MKHLRLGIVSLILCLVTTTVADPIYSYYNRFHPIIADQGMVASQEKRATEVGLNILKQGGNAIDAAVATGFALAVTLPRAGNLGGGGFMLVYLHETDSVIALDYREVAPLLSSEKMFLDKNGNPDSELSTNSILASGVPGTVAGLLDIQQKYGKLSRQAVLAPAIKLASEGFPVSYDLHESLKQAAPKLADYPASKEIFLDENNNPPEVGKLLIQKDLAATLQELSDIGKSAFYEGDISDKIANYMVSQNGLITKQDLKDYKPVYRTPVEGSYRGYKVVSMPPPSSGGIHLIQMLNTLEPFDIADLGHNSADYIQVLAESMKQAYADRSQWLGDPDYVDIPQSKLLSKQYGEQIAETFSNKTLSASSYLSNTKSNLVLKRIPSPKIHPINQSELDKIPYESNETTHFSVVDQWGNAVSNTYTLNFSYGNKQVVPGTGILLNNEMDDFSAKPGAQNAYGLIGGSANKIAPQKRMLSSMTPTILFDNNGDLFLVTGTPGGSRIITSVLQTILNVVDFDMNIAEAQNAPRIHHQWYPEEIRIEKGISPDSIKLLEKRGYTIATKWAMGSMQSILINNDSYEGSSDPRKPGAATLGY